MVARVHFRLGIIQLEIYGFIFYERSYFLAFPQDPILSSAINVEDKEKNDYRDLFPRIR